MAIETEGKNLSANRLAKTLKLNDGRTLGFAEYGDPRGRPAFYFHGWPSSRLEVAPADALAHQMGVRLVAPDRPGCGLSTFKIGRRLEDWPADLLQLVDHLGFQSFTIIGNSGGGPYAAACAAYLPDRVDELLLLCGLGPTDIPECAKQFPSSSRLALAIGRRMPRIAAAITGMVFAKMYHEDRVLFSETMQSRLPESDRLALQNHEWRESLASAVRESFRHGVRGPAWEGAVYAQPWKFSLSSIRVPSRLWHGEVDPIVPVEMGRHYARSIPGCQANFYPNEGHFSLPCNRMAEIFQAVCH